MKKIRCTLATIALIVTMSGPIFLGLGTGSFVSAVSSQHVSATFVSGQSARSIAFKRLGPCPTGGTSDC